MKVEIYFFQQPPLFSLDILQSSEAGYEGNLEYCHYCGNDNSEDEFSFCFNFDCTVYMCSKCYKKTRSGKILCKLCATQCNLCKSYINKEEDKLYVDTWCKNCFKQDIIYCLFCVEKYHFRKCSNTFCEECLPRCRKCKSLSCCEGFHKQKSFIDRLCLRCFNEDYFKYKKEFIKDILKDSLLVKDVHNIVLKYYLYQG